MAYIKFGWGRATREACSDIRCGHLTREEGVALAQKYDHEFPKKYLKTFLKYVDITEERFWEIVDKYRSEKIWQKNPDYAKKLGKEGLINLDGIVESYVYLYNQPKEAWTFELDLRTSIEKW